jgi:hypothetical protein
VAADSRPDLDPRGLAVRSSHLPVVLKGLIIEGQRRIYVRSRSGSAWRILSRADGVD